MTKTTMELRSYKSDSVLSSSKSKSKSKSSVEPIYSIKPIKKNSISKTTSQPNAEFDQIKKVVNTVMDEIVILRKTFMDFQNKIEQSIGTMNASINAKSKNFVIMTNSLQNEIDSIKKTLRINNELVKNSIPVSMDTRLTHILHGEAITQLEYEYATQLERLQCKVNEIEKSNEQAADTVNDLVTSISTFMADSTVLHRSVEADEKIVDIENAIKCLEHEIDRMKTASFGDGEKIIKMNKQIHVLSAKYVDFNIKVNRHLLDFNRNTINKIDADKVIDIDAVPFMTTKDCVKSSEIKIDELPSKTKLSSCRFVQPFMKSDYTRFIRVKVNDTNINNLDQFNRDFTSEFEQCIGKNIVKRVTINKYQLHDGKTKSISCVVEFMIPLNFEYINNFKFPGNWDFSTIFKQQQHLNRSMTSTSPQRMQRMTMRYGSK